MSKKYLYSVNCQNFERSLFEMEMKYLLKENPLKKYVFSKINIDPSRSPFIKHKLLIIYSGTSLQEIIEKIQFDKLSYEGFKVNYIKSEDEDVEYSERLSAVSKIGFVITGFPDLHNPKINLAITKVKDMWIFGELYKNDNKWLKHDEKPYSYSNALSVKMARAILNIAINNNINLKIIDPCCGIGTVVIEGLDLGLNIKGYEISKQIACNARNNLEHFGYDRDLIECKDMHTISEKFDIAIVDIPYGIFSPVTLEEQINILNTSFKIANKLVLISFEIMDKYLEEIGFSVIDQTVISKNKFNRYITICE